MQRSKARGSCKVGGSDITLAIRVTTPKILLGWRVLCQMASTEEVNGRPRPAIPVLVIANKEMQTTTSGLRAKQGLLKHSYTLKGTAGCFCEVIPALLYRLKGIYKERSVRREGAIMGE